MATGRKHAPKYRHYRPKNLGVVRLDGKDHYCPGPYGSDESWSHYYQLLADWRAGKLEVPDSRSSTRPTSDAEKPSTIGELMLRYWAHVKRHYRKDGKPTSEQACIHGALKYLRRLYAQTPPSEFSAPALKAVRQSMIEASLARSTVNKHTGRIRRAFKWAVSERLVELATYQELCTVEDLRKDRSDARETKRIRPVAEDRMRAVLPALSRVLRAMVLFQWYTGCRPTEACLLRPADIDRDGDVWCYWPERHKTEHHDLERRIYIGRQAQEILRPLLDRPEDAYCVTGRIKTSHRGAKLGQPG